LKLLYVEKYTHTHLNVNYTDKQHIRPTDLMRSVAMMSGRGTIAQRRMIVTSEKP